MLKWIVTLVLTLFLLGLLTPHLARFIRFGQLPGDVVVRRNGREYPFPLTSTLLLSGLLWLIGRLF